MVPFYVGQDLGSQQTTAVLKRPSQAPEQHAEVHSFPSLATSHLAVKPSSALATFDYSLIAEIPACPYLKKNQKPKPHKASKGGEGPNSTLEELSSLRACEPHPSALTSGSARGTLPNGSPGHHVDHSQSRGVHTTSQRQTGDHTLPRSSGQANGDKFPGNPRKIPRKQAQ